MAPAAIRSATIRRRLQARRAEAVDFVIAGVV